LLGMSESSRIAHLLVFLFLLSVAIVLLIQPINLERSDIPSILEGLTSCISIMIGFTATIFAIMFQRNISRFSYRDISQILVSLMFPMGILVFVYFSLVLGMSLYDALKLATFDLVVTFLIFFYLLNFLYVRYKEVISP